MYVCMYVIISLSYLLSHCAPSVYPQQVLQWVGSFILWHEISYIAHKYNASKAVSRSGMKLGMYIPRYISHFITWYVGTLILSHQGE
jgi:hypothetical protein